MTKAFEFCKRVRRILLISMGESLVHGTVHTEDQKYKPWSPEFVVENINDARKAAASENWKKLQMVSFDPNELTIREMQALGFLIWRLEDSPYVIWLIPQWLVLYVTSGVKMTDIFGKEETFYRTGDKTLPLDHRGGMVSFGVKKRSSKKQSE